MAVPVTVTLDAFRAHLESTESPRTVLAYVPDVAAFESVREGRPCDMNAYESWTVSLNGLKPQTLKRKQAAVRRWLAFRARYGDIDARDALTVLQGGYQVGRGVRQADVTSPYSVTEQEYLAASREAPPWGRYLMFLLWWSGARISEVVGDPVARIPHLTVRHGRELVERGYTETWGKGGKARVLLLPSRAARLFAPWPGSQEHEAGALFPSPRLSVSLSARAVNAMMHGAGLACGAHAFRHAYKTKLRRAGIQEEVIRALLGHGPRDVTDRYGKVSLDEMREAVERL